MQPAPTSCSSTGARRPRKGLDRLAGRRGSARPVADGRLRAGRRAAGRPGRWPPTWPSPAAWSSRRTSGCVDEGLVDRPARRRHGGGAAAAVLRRAGAPGAPGSGPLRRCCRRLAGRRRARPVAGRAGPVRVPAGGLAAGRAGGAARPTGAADLGYGDPRGSARLRAELAGWLARTRGLRVDAGRDHRGGRGGAGARAAGPDAAGRRGHAIAVEDPGSRGARDQLAHWGLTPGAGAGRRATGWRGDAGRAPARPRRC